MSKRFIKIGNVLVNLERLDYVQPYTSDEYCLSYGENYTVLSVEDYKKLEAYLILNGEVHAIESDDE
jgi:hypothetical protein